LDSWPLILTLAAFVRRRGKTKGAGPRTVRLPMLQKRLLADAGQVEREARAERHAGVVRGHLRRGRHVVDLGVLDVSHAIAGAARDREAGLHRPLHEAHHVEADRAALELEGAARAGDLTAQGIETETRAQTKARRRAAREE